jgi:alkanesulfonate monooxygenase SsuD/methylene tetrahydromethanopterin reductase-like flavin-dependent oxidoreductase (luciferase family)
MLEIPAGARVCGLQLPVQAQSTYFVADWERRAGPAEQARIARAADASGFFYVAVCDHVAIPRAMADTTGTYWQDCLTTLGWLAAHTTRTALLSHIYVLAFRHPLVAAKGFATLDHLSGGRAVVGVGAGHVQAEFAALGVDFERRGRLLDGGLTTLLAALGDEYVGDVGARPRPVQTPRPPVWVGGSSPPALRRAARLGDGWLPQGPADGALVTRLLDELETAGRADVPFAIGHITPFIHVGRPKWDVGGPTVSGSPDQIVEGLLEGLPAAVNQLQVRFRCRSADECCDQIEAFGRDVAPLLDGTGADRER